MTVTISGVTDSWINSLTSPGIKADMQAMAAGGTMTYAGVVKLLDDVAAQGTVTAVEFADLQTIVANLNIGIGVSDYLASELTQLIDGDPANAVWTGGQKTTTPLGNLAAGTSAADLNELIGKWFLGTDLPNPTQSGARLDYVTYNLQPFGATGVPVVTDIMQGILGDCVLCSTLIEMVDNHLPELESMIVNDGNGVYGVRFFVNGEELWETVNSALPTYTSRGGGLVDMNAYNTTGVGFWADLIEKAYAQLSATGEIDHPAVNSYNNINGNYDSDLLTNIAGATNIPDFFYNDPSWSYAKQIVIDALQSGEDVLMDSNSNTYDSSGNQEFMSDHCFAVVGYDSTAGDFILRNPWGTTATSTGEIAGQGTGDPYYVQFEASMSQIAAVEGDISVDNTALSQVEITVAEGATQDVPVNGSISISSLFLIADTTGATIKDYNLQVVGAGSLALNGAVNLATPAQTAAGQIVVSASQIGDVTYVGGASAGGGELLLSAYDGSVWSPTADLAMTVSPATVSLLPEFNRIVAASGTIALSSLFGVSGTMGGGASYQVQILSGGGSFNLNGAANLGQGSTIDFSATDLLKITYTASASSGPVVFSISAYDGSNWTDAQDVNLLVGATAIAALQDFDNGNVWAGEAIDDSAANIFANLDGVQVAVSAERILAIQLTDASAPTETISGTQAIADLGALSLIGGAYTLDVSGMTAAILSANIDALQALGHIGSIILADSADAIVVTQIQATADAGVLGAIAGAHIVETTNITGRSYSGDEFFYGANGTLTEQEYTGVTGSGTLSAYAYFYANGAQIGTDEFFTGITGQIYTGEEIDYNGGGLLTRDLFTGVTSQPFSSYEYDFVGGVFSGAKYNFTTVAVGATYSSYVDDQSVTNTFAGAQYYFTNISGQNYTGAEEDVDKNGALSRFVETGLTGEPYSSLEYDFSAGVYSGAKLFYTGITGTSYTALEVDVSAPGQLTKAVYSGMNSTPYSSVEMDYSGGSVSDAIYSFTNVTGEYYYAYQMMENGGGSALQETLDLVNGGHQSMALTGGQTLTSLGDDSFIGNGATTFTLNAIYGADTITNFRANDTISLAASEYAQLSSVIANGNYAGGNAVLSFGDGDTLTVNGFSKTALTALSANFISHG